jgi:hypothetical protein
MACEFRRQRSPTFPYTTSGLFGSSSIKKAHVAILVSDIALKRVLEMVF